MKYIKKRQEFNETSENLNISDVSNLFSDKKLKKMFFDIFTHDDSEIDIHINNHDYDVFINYGLLRKAGHSASDRVVLRLTEKGKNIFNRK